MTYVYFWAKPDGGGPATAGGFMRCDSIRELIEFVADCQRRGLAIRVAR